MMNNDPKPLAAPLPEPTKDNGLTDVYEVYGSTARASGWDFTVCTSLKDALSRVERDLDDLDADPEKEDEVRIVFRRYTAAQMEDVIYE